MSCHVASVRRATPFAFNPERVESDTVQANRSPFEHVCRHVSFRTSGSRFLRLSAIGLDRLISSSPRFRLDRASAHVASDRREAQAHPAKVILATHARVVEVPLLDSIRVQRAACPTANHINRAVVCIMVDELYRRERR